MRNRTFTSALGIVVVAGIALTGCSANTQADSGTVTVSRLSGDDEIWQSIADGFHAANPDLTIEYTIIPTDSYNQQVSTRISAGTATDVLNVFPGTGTATSAGQLAKNGYLADLSSEPWAADVPESVTSVTNIDGKSYMYTDLATANTIGPIYNMDAMDEAGLAIPTTWTELLAFCDDANAAGKVPFALGAQTQWVTQLVTYALAGTLVYGEDPDFDDKQLAGETTFQDSAWLEALEKYKELFDSKCFNQDALGTSVENASIMVGEGNALAAVQISTIGSQMVAANPDVTLKQAPLPATDDPTTTQLPLGLGVGWGVNAKAKNMAGGLKFLEYLNTPEASKLNANAYGLSPNGGEVEASEINELEIPLVEDGRTVPFMDVRWPSAKVQNLHFTGVQELLGGSKTPEQVLTEMQDAYTEAL